MSKNENESSEDSSLSEDSSDDGYSDDGVEYRHYFNPLMYYVPREMRSDVRKLCKDTARVYVDREPIKRTVNHYPIVQEKTETCMQEDCDKLTSGKCGRCHVFLCIDSENDCFTKFHDTYWE